MSLEPPHKPQPNQQDGAYSASKHAIQGAGDNVHEAKDAVSRATASISNLVSGKGNMVDAAVAVKGAYDNVVGLTGRLSATAMMPVMKALSAFKGQAVLPAGKQMDPVMGIDVHMVFYPPVPAPVPLPHPYIGILFNPKDWVSCAINTFKKDILDALPEPAEGDTSKMASIAKNKDAIAGIAMGLAGMSASVKFGDYVPRAVTGTKVKNIPHIPMGPSFHPGFSAAVAKNDGKAFLGSLFVAADGDPMVGSFHLNYDCWDIGIVDLFKSRRAGGIKDPEAGGPQAELFVPSGTVLPIPWGRPVLVNSIPTPINPMAILDRLFKAGLGKLKAAGRKAVQKQLDKLTGKVACGPLTAVSKAIGTSQSHPVDVSGGYFYTDNEDFKLPGPIPLCWERTWYSNSDYKGPLGYGWHHSYDMALALDEETGMAVMRLSDGRPAVFDMPVVEHPSYNRSEKLFLHLHEEGYHYAVNNKGLIYRFTAKEYTNSTSNTQTHLLQSIASRNGFAICFAYGSNGLLKQITDSSGRILVVNNDSRGRITSIHAPDPRFGGRSSFAIAGYAYTDEGDMAEQTDAIDRTMKFAYNNHLMCKEVWRNGLSWTFRYDKAAGTNAKCTEVWGDGNLLHYTFDYTDPQCTVVTDSLGHRKLFYHRNGVVVKYIDPSGAPWVYKYNKHNELEWRTDPLGNQTGYTYDQWGNTAATTAPDGLFCKIDYANPVFPWLLTTATDQGGGKWLFGYDNAGNLTKIKDPIEANSVFVYKEGLLHKIISAAAASTILVYDSSYNLNALAYPDGTAEYLEYDRLGNCIKSTDVKGNLTKRVFDLAGRLVLIETPDGNTKQLAYDGIDNLIMYKDHDREIKMDYNGMGKLRSRSEAGKTMQFIYNTENHLIKVINEHALTYSFDLDADGRIMGEIDFNGSAKTFERNAAGWITQVNRPGKRFTKYSYDEAGRLLSTVYHDATKETYTYEYGNLSQVTNAEGIVSFERDILGRITKESCNQHNVQSNYNASSKRTGITSSLGAEIALNYDIMGCVTGLNANGWQGVIKSDEAGLEIEKQFIEGLIERWNRDKVGRPVKHLVGNSLVLAPNNLSHSRKYNWSINDQLTRMTDHESGVTSFKHDRCGNLVKTVFNDGEEQLRNPDAVGNLFENEDRTDRIYGRDGKLLKSKKASYKYDEEGNLIEKKENNGSVWQYQWNGAGMLAAVVRPDKFTVSFGYDVLGRRLWKKYKHTVTKYIWDGNKPLHEWKEFDAAGASPDAVITWVFEENSFSPVAKLKGAKRYLLITDHLGTPVQGYNEAGEVIWQRDLDSYGRVKMIKGDEGFCNYLYQGQVLDNETGLAYNRFRYYDPEEGTYISQDPIGLQGGMELYRYVGDTNLYVDLLGLSDSEKLGKDLNANGDPKPPGNYDAHHMVQAGSQKPSMVALRNQMASYNPPVDINSHENGVWLPHRSGDRVAGDKSTAHGGEGVHSDDYKDKLSKRLAGLNRQSFLNELAKLKKELQNGTTYKVK